MKGTCIDGASLRRAWRDAAPAYADERQARLHQQDGRASLVRRRSRPAPRPPPPKLGVKLSTQDVQFNADLTLTTFDTMVGDGVKGIAIVVPDKALGPVVAEKAAKANIKLIAVDDDIYSQDKTMVPYIGMNARRSAARSGPRRRGSTRRSVGRQEGRRSSPPSRTARPTPACSARAAPRRLSSKPCPASTRRTSFAFPMTTR